MQNGEQNRSWDFALAGWARALAYALAFLAAILTTSLHAQTLTVLHEFTGHNDGARPGGLIKDRAGNLYGSTAYGGDFSCNGGDGGVPGCGVLFEVKRDGSGWILNPLYIFPGSGQGDLSNYPGGLAIGPNGSLYGTNFWEETASESMGMAAFSTRLRRPLRHRRCSLHGPTASSTSSRGARMVQILRGRRRSFSTRREISMALPAMAAPPITTVLSTKQRARETVGR